MGGSTTQQGHTVSIQSMLTHAAQFRYAVTTHPKKKRGVDWTSGDIDDIGGLDSVINGDLGVERDADGKIIPGARAIYVVGSVLRAVGESGEVLAFPPLHIHHLHVNNGPQDNYFDHFPFVEMHGDSGA